MEKLICCRVTKRRMPQRLLWCQPQVGEGPGGRWLRLPCLPLPAVASLPAFLFTHAVRAPALEQHQLLTASDGSGICVTHPPPSHIPPYCCCAGGKGKRKADEAESGEGGGKKARIEDTAEAAAGGDDFVDLLSSDDD